MNWVFEFADPNTEQTHLLHRKIININLPEHKHNRKSLIIYRINCSIGMHVSVKNCMSSVCMKYERLSPIFTLATTIAKIIHLFWRKLAWCTLIKRQLHFTVVLFHFRAKKGDMNIKNINWKSIFLLIFIFRFRHFRLETKELFINWYTDFLLLKWIAFLMVMRLLISH